MQQRTNQFRPMQIMLPALLVAMFSGPSFARTADGACQDGIEWVSEAASVSATQGSYGDCAPGQGAVRFTCLPSLGTVDIRVDRPVAGLAPGDTMIADIDVDGQRFSTLAYGGPVPSGIGPVLRLKMGDPIVQALSDGEAAIVRIGKTYTRLHLIGSKATVSGLRKACEQRRRCPAFPAKKGCGRQGTLGVAGDRSEG